MLRLLIAGILIVPILFILAGLIYRQFLEQREEAEIAVYRDIAAMLDEQIDFENQVLFSRFISHASRIGDIAIFRRDLLVIHSTIPELSPGVFESQQNIFALLERKDTQYSYSFESPPWLDNHGYILIQKSNKPPPGFPLGPWSLLFLFLLFFLILFAITMSMFIARSITNSIMVIEDATKRIAEGELDLAVEARGSNEITSLTNNLNEPPRSRAPRYP